MPVAKLRRDRVWEGIDRPVRAHLDVPDFTGQRHAIGALVLSRLPLGRHRVRALLNLQPVAGSPSTSTVPAVPSTTTKAPSGMRLLPSFV